MANRDEGLTLDPIPSILIESLRDIGYSFETALADIVDNSLTANATEVSIRTVTLPEPVVAVVDNGEGLSRDELIDSMRLGSKDPRKDREKTDLGRYGLGLKTASFSQCRRLTVASKKNGAVAAFTWDLDEVVRLNAWMIEEVSDPDAIPFIETLGESGTIVVWEKLDRICPDSITPKQAENAFNRHVSDAADHLGLVFHRFLTPERGFKPVKMTLNDGAIQARDPFATRHPATIQGPAEVVAEGVTVQSFTLPHSSKYKSKQEYEQNGLSGGYIKNQGIYLYRARRLIIFGTWFGLAKKTALTQLCRVKVDIDNTHDEDWKIDVKKASAQLPEGVRAEVKNLLNAFESPSVRVYKRRGAKQVNTNMHPVWNSLADNGRVMFRVNTENPTISHFRNELSDYEQRDFDLILRLISSEFPVDALYVELANGREGVSNTSLNDDDIGPIAKSFFAELKSRGQDDLHILDVMRSIDVFNTHWQETLAALGIEEG